MPKTTPTLEERKELQEFYDSIDDRSLPSSFNSRTKGIVVFYIFNKSLFVF